MQDYRPFSRHGDHNHHETDPGSGPAHDTSLSLWIAAVTVIISLGAMLLFAQGDLKNGGAPFVITPPTQINAYPATGH